VKKFGLGANRSFGFIAPHSGGPDAFVHQDNLAPGVKTLAQGQKVAFKRVQGEKGPEAHDVRLIV
jgi:CspA family cold shock protein